MIRTALEHRLDLHLDPLGGLSGDMFVAAMLDAFPDLWPSVQGAVAALDLGPEASCTLVAHRDHALTGRRFLVSAEPSGHSHHEEARAPQAQGHHVHAVDHRHEHDRTIQHGHRTWANIRDLIAGSTLDRLIKDHSVAIFRLLAQAEAEVHGVGEDEVTFHEVGALDSIVDVVAAATIITALDASAWSCSPLPLGAGRVRTAHGILPVPAPATALLLRGLDTIDDGIAGERVTPTGAAIARYLLAGDGPERRARRLTRTGTGFGARTLPGISNCLRVLVFEEPALAGGEAPAAFTHRDLGLISFEVDDQSPEDLSTGLDRLRTMPGVHDVIQSVVFGKKNRMATHVQVLAAPEALDAVTAGCFIETTTIGLRYQIVKGAVLNRTTDEVEVEGRLLRVKIVERPGGARTAKAESDDTVSAAGAAQRSGLRREAEAKALARPAPKVGGTGRTT